MLSNWGFDPAAITRPVLLWHGAQDTFSPAGWAMMRRSESVRPSRIDTKSWAGSSRIAVAAPTAAPDRPGAAFAALDDAEGLTVLLGPASGVGRSLAAGRTDRAVKLLARRREIYRDALRLEASLSYGGEGTGPGSLRTVGFAAGQRVRPVLGGAVRYADPGMGPVAAVLGRRPPPRPRRRPQPDRGEAWLMDAGAMHGPGRTDRCHRGDRLSSVPRDELHLRWDGARCHEAARRQLRCRAVEVTGRHPVSATAALIETSVMRSHWIAGRGWCG